METKVGQTAEDLINFRNQYSTKRVLDQRQIDSMVNANNALNREIKSLNHSVVMEEQAIRQLGDFVYEKNKVVDATVLIMRDLQKQMHDQQTAIKRTDAAQAELCDNIQALFAQLGLVEKKHNAMRDVVNENTAIVKKQLESFNNGMKSVVKNNNEFKEWTQSQFKNMALQYNMQQQLDSAAVKKLIDDDLKELAALSDEYHYLRNIRLPKIEDQIKLMKEHQVCSCNANGNNLQQVEIENLLDL